MRITIILLIGYAHFLRYSIILFFQEIKYFNENVVKYILSTQLSLLI